MSKRTQLKLKKILKKADFVHADLEYHEELLVDAKIEFNESFRAAIDALPQDKKDQYNSQKQQQAQKPVLEQDPSNESKNTSLEKTKNVLITPEEPDGVDLNHEEEIPEDEKASMNKSLYYKIAAKTHPDKLVSSDMSSREKENMSKIFKKAKEAYENNNWYSLYSEATNLGIDTGDPDDRHIGWIEEDMRKAMEKISQIGQLYAWVWYVADEDRRNEIMKSYIGHVYGIEY